MEQKGAHADRAGSARSADQRLSSPGLGVFRCTVCHVYRRSADGQGNQRSPPQRHTLLDSFPNAERSTHATALTYPHFDSRALYCNGGTYLHVQSGASDGTTDADRTAHDASYGNGNAQSHAQPTASDGYTDADIP